MVILAGLEAVESVTEFAECCASSIARDFHGFLFCGGGLPEMSAHPHIRLPCWHIQVRDRPVVVT
jgi:hypothetical protein